MLSHVPSIQRWHLIWKWVVPCQQVPRSDWKITVDTTKSNWQLSYMCICSKTWSHPQPGQAVQQGSMHVPGQTESQRMCFLGAWGNRTSLSTGQGLHCAASVKGHCLKHAREETRTRSVEPWESVKWNTWTMYFIILKIHMFVRKAACGVLKALHI